VALENGDQSAIILTWFIWLGCYY